MDTLELSEPRYSCIYEVKSLNPENFESELLEMDVYRAILGGAKIKIGKSKIYDF